MNGNEYEHIWQTPLPKPRTLSTDTATSSEEEGKTTPTRSDSGGVKEGDVKEGGSTPGESYTQCTTDNKENEDRDRPYYIRSKDIYNGSPKDGCRTESGYSTLRKNASAKNLITNCPPADV